jgi:hypothetical protein
MRNAILVSVLAAVLMAASATAFAGAPINGTYKSTSGDFDEGTAATSSSGAAGYLSVGNVLYAQSVVGLVFTSDWLIGCPMIASVIILGSSPITGGVNVDYMITYTGGYVQLGGPGTPWNGGDPSYSGALDTFVEFRTTQYVGGVVKGSVSDFTVAGHLQGYPQTCMTWAIANGSLRGGTGFVAPLQSVKPAGYPDYHNALCAVAGTTGHFDDVRDITLSIVGCAVATTPSTWGAVKSIYRK